MPLHVESTNKVPLWSFIVRDRYLPPTEASIKSMMLSLEKLGQIAPIVARKVASDKYQLVVGATRFAAARELGWTNIQASIVTADNELEYQLAEIDENWERRELSKEERAKMREDRAELQRKIMAAVQPAKGGRGKKGGISEAAREAGISRATAYRKKPVSHSAIETGLGKMPTTKAKPANPDQPTKTARAAAASQALPGTIGPIPDLPESGQAELAAEESREPMPPLMGSSLRCCSFCGEIASAERILIGADHRPGVHICDCCVAEAAALIAAQRASAPGGAQLVLASPAKHPVAP